VVDLLIFLISEQDHPAAILDHFEKNGALSHAHYRPRPRGSPAVAA
jgi:hypothetical protein